MDAAGPETLRPYIEAANPTHPSLVDLDHRLAERFGVLNIPAGIWIDEQGTIVRPAEPAFPGIKPSLNAGDPDKLPRRMRDVLAEAAKIRTDPEAYAEALRDWAALGADSRFALTADEVVARSGRRDDEAARAAAHFDLAGHLHRTGDSEGAVRHYREAHRLQPENLSYKRQAWSLAAPGAGPFERFWQGPVEGREDEWPYESDWLTEVREIGAENYYPPLR